MTPGSREGSPPTTTPVFIVGAPRSGTSILYRTLLKHPSFAVDGDEALQLAESAVLEQLPAAPRWRPPRPPRLWLYFLRDQVAYDAFTTQVREVAATSPPAEAKDGRPPWTGPVLELFVQHAARARSCRRLIEKTPTHIDRAEWLLESLPGARLLFVRRHPLTTYASYRRRARVDPRATWADLSPLAFAEIYRRHSDRARTFSAAHPDRFREVAYEDFTADPAMETARLCDFLDEPFVPDMVREESPDLSRSVNDPLLFAAITRETGRWSDLVDTGTATLVEDLTESQLEAWGYRRYTTASR